MSATGWLWLVLDDSHRRVPFVIRERCKHLHAINIREPLLAFSDPPSDIKVGIRHASPFPGLRLPGLPHPAPSPPDVSRVLRGLLLRSSSRSCFIPLPLAGFPALI
jgi:hypothetical protein